LGKNQKNIPKKREKNVLKFGLIKEKIENGPENTPYINPVKIFPKLDLGLMVDLLK